MFYFFALRNHYGTAVMHAKITNFFKY